MWLYIIFLNSMPLGRVGRVMTYHFNNNTGIEALDAS